jgi:hypothetical protein
MANSNRVWEKCVVVAVVSTSAALVACAGAADGSDAEDLGSVENALVPAGPYNEGSIDLTIGPGFVDLNKDARGSYDPPGACFLTRIKGRFEGGAESVKVVKQTNGVWRLSGTSQQVNTAGSAQLAATAACVQDPVTHSGSWSKGQNPKFLRTGGTCFLTSVYGKFVGGAEFVDLSLDSSNRWYLSGGSATNQGIGATASCVDATQLHQTYASGSTFSKRLALMSSNACFLQRVGGGLRGYGEQLQVVRGTNSSFFWFNGDSQSGPINGTASCIPAKGTILNL